MSRQDARAGLFFGLSAYGLWGVLPLYLNEVTNSVGVPPFELLAHRVVWSAVLLAAICGVRRRWAEVGACFGRRRTFLFLLVGTLLIGANWYVFIVGIRENKTLENSLGYFINPLLNIVLGVILFRERLRIVPRIALLVATGGIAYLIVARGETPWIALFLATSFAAYGLVRKLAPVDSLVGVTVETLILAPVGLGYLIWLAVEGAGTMGRAGRYADVLLLLSGPATAIPLLCFGGAARRLPLSTLGFLQYLAPTLQFVCAVTVFEQTFDRPWQIAYACTWVALAAVTVDAVVARRAAIKSASDEADPSAEMTA